MSTDESAVLPANLAQLQVAPTAVQQIVSCEPAGCRLEILPDDQAQLFFQDKAIYAGERPQDTAAGQTQQLLDGKSPDLIVFFGFGLGSHVAAMRQHTSAPIVVFEPSVDVAAFVLARVTVEVPDVYLASDRDGYADILGSLMGPGRPEVIAGAIPSYLELFPAQFAEFQQGVNEAIDALEIGRKTRERFSVEWVANLAGNLCFLGSGKSLNALGREFAGKPAILVGAGPSLDTNLHVLAEAKGRALVAAVHTSVLPLVKAGITPDLVIITEGQNLEHFFGGVPELAQMVLLVSPQTHPVHLTLGFKDYLGLTLDGNAAADWQEQAYGEKPLVTGGSVACTAFSALHEMGCDPIALVGVDTAYNETRGHALNSDTGCCGVTFDHEQKTVTTHCDDGVHEQFVFRLDLVTAWGGEKQVATRPVLASFRHWFETVARTWGADHVLINATEGGARIRGFRELTLANFLAEYGAEPLPVSEIMSSALATAGKRDSAPFVGAVEAELSVIRQAGEAAKLADTVAEKALAKLHNQDFATVQPLLDELSRREGELQVFTLKTRLLNTLVGHRAEELSVQKASGDHVAQTIHSLEQSRRISRLVIDGAAELLAQFEPALQGLAERKGHR